MFKYKKAIVRWSIEEFKSIQNDVDYMLQDLKHVSFTLNNDQRIYANRIKVKSIFTNSHSNIDSITHKSIFLFKI